MYGKINIPDSSGDVFIPNLNDALLTLAQNWRNGAEPNPAYPNQFWVDTSQTPNVLKIRNAANDAWFTIGPIQANLGLLPASEVSNVPAANKVLRMDSQGELPASADKVDGHDAGNLANNVLVLDENGQVPSANLPIATEDEVGAVRIGNGVEIDENGVISTVPVRVTDRQTVLQAPVTWEGIPAYIDCFSDDLVPILSGPSGGGFTVSSSTPTDAGLYPGWKVFDGSAVTYFESAQGANNYLQIYNATAFKVLRYSFTCITPNTAPFSWRTKLSNDGTNWTTVETRYFVGQWEAGETRDFFIDVGMVGSYKYIKWEIFQVQNGGTTVQIQDCTIRTYKNSLGLTASADDPICLTWAGGNTYKGGTDYAALIEAPVTLAADFTALAADSFHYFYAELDISTKTVSYGVRTSAKDANGNPVRTCPVFLEALTPNYPYYSNWDYFVKNRMRYYEWNGSQMTQKYRVTLLELQLDASKNVVRCVPAAIRNTCVISRAQQLNFIEANKVYTRYHGIFCEPQIVELQGAYSTDAGTGRGKLSRFIPSYSGGTYNGAEIYYVDHAMFKIKTGASNYILNNDGNVASQGNEIVATLKRGF